jgi:hypothetical protein
MGERGTTPSELIWPSTPEFVEAALKMAQGTTDQMLQAVWDGFDQFRSTQLAKVDLSQADAEVERTITQLLVPYIRKQLDPFAPFYVEHGWRETETRMPPPAQSPEYDIAFVFHANMRVAWPLEAKVLRSARRTAPYVKDIENEFLTCRYAPFSAGGGMVGYLMKDSIARTLSNISRALGKPLFKYALFGDRQHRISRHKRTVPHGKAYPKEFTCHHLILPMTGHTGA